MNQENKWKLKEKNGAYGLLTVILTVFVIGGGYCAAGSFAGAQTEKTAQQKSTIVVNIEEKNRLENEIFSMPWEEDGEFVPAELTEDEWFSLQYLAKELNFQGRLEETVQYRESDGMYLCGSIEENGMIVAFSRETGTMAYQFPVEKDDVYKQQEVQELLEENQDVMGSLIYQPIYLLNTHLNNLGIESRLGDAFAKNMENEKNAGDSTFLFELEKEIFIHNGELCVLAYKENEYYILAKYDQEDASVYQVKAADWN